MFDSKNDEFKGKFEDHGKAVRSLKFSPNNQLLITGGEDLHINVTDVDAM